MYFKVLPTEDRFKQLTYEQKMLLLVGFLEMPTPEQMKYNFDVSKSGPKLDTDDEDNFKKLGYSSESINRIKDQLRKAGIME